MRGCGMLFPRWGHAHTLEAASGKDYYVERCLSTRSWRNMRKSIIVALLLLMSGFTVVALLPETVSATTLYVGGAGPGNYTTIQAAVDDGNPGDTVYVYGGTYFEGLSISKTLTLTGESRDTTIVDGHGLAVAVRVTATWANITSLTITNSSLLYQAGLILHGAHNSRVENVNMSGNFDGLVVSESNSTLVANNTLSWNGRRGLHVSQSNYTTVIGNNLSDNWDSGVELSDSHNNTVQGNTASGNGLAGIQITHSFNTTVSGNVMVENGLGMSGDSVEHWNTHMIGPSNTVNGKPIRYWSDVIGGTLTPDAGQVILANCTDVTVQNLNMDNGSYGVTLAFSSNNTVEGNALLSQRWYGVLVHHSDWNTVAFNTLRSNRANGIHVYRSHNNTIDSNNVSENKVGIDLMFSSGNEIRNNTVLNNQYGVTLHLSDNNSVYHNHFSGNQSHGRDSLGNNTWDNGYPSGGNIWPDYVGVDDCSGPNQDVCPDPDGIGDDPYTVDGDVQDRYPLLGPGFEPNHPPVASFTVTPTEGNVSTVFTLNASASYDVEDMTSELTFEWDFYDRGEWDASGMIVQKKYSLPGNYTIRLRVTDTGGRTGTTTQLVTVAPVEIEVISCRIEDPLPGATVFGNYTIEGTAVFPNGDAKGVQIRIDNGSWMEADGTTTWSFAWDTTKVPDGEHTISARAYNVTEISEVVTTYSKVVNVTIIVDNTARSHGDPFLGHVLILAMVSLVVVMVTAGLALRARRRAKD